MLANVKWKGLSLVQETLKPQLLSRVQHLAADMAAVQKMALRLIGTSFAQTLRSPTSSITDFKSFDSRIEVTSKVLKF